MEYTPVERDSQINIEIPRYYDNCGGKYNSDAVWGNTHIPVTLATRVAQLEERLAQLEAKLS